MTSPRRKLFEIWVEESDLKNYEYYEGFISKRDPKLLSDDDDYLSMADKPFVHFVEVSPDLDKAVERMVEALKTIDQEVCDGGGDKPCSQMWYQDVAREALEAYEKASGK